MALAAAHLWWPVRAIAQTSAHVPTTRPVRGTVYDARSSAGVAAEFLIDGLVVARADSTGRFTLAVATVAGATVSRPIQVRAIGYRHTTVALPALPDSARSLDIPLTPLVLALASMQTVAQREERAAFGDLPTTGALAFTSGELRHTPAIGDRDVLRVVALLPGIATRNDLSSSFNVRGGEADQNLVLLDGIPIYNPFHFGGLFGTFIDATVGRVEVLTGGFPSEFGGRLSSVLEVKSAEETRPGVHATTDLSVLASSARLAGALGDGRVSWSVAGRRTYADKLIALLRGANEFPYHFRDAQAFVRVALPNDGSLVAAAYSGVDVLEEQPAAAAAGGTLEQVRRVAFDWGNTVGGVTWTQPLGARTTLVQRVTHSTFRTAFAIAAESLSIRQRMGDTRLGGRLVHRTAQHAVTLGYEVSGIRSAYRERMRIAEDSPFPDGASDGDTTVAQRGAAAALFLEDVWRITPHLVLRPGVRAERVPGAEWSAISPRLSARYFVSPDLAITASAGRHAQWTHAVRNEDLPLRLFDLWMVADADVPVSTANHVVLGAERWLSSSRFVRVEGYGKRFSGLSEPGSSIDPRVRPSLLQTFGGTSYGADVMLRQLERGGVSGWLTYSYAVSRREQGGERYFAAHDRRHNANAVLAWTPDRRWTLGLHAGVASGTPYTGWAGRMSRWQYDPLLGQWAPVRLANDADIVHGARNASRLPAYARLDLSAERRFSVGRTTLVPAVSLVNVMNRENVLLYALDQQGEALRIARHAQFPLLPSVGLRAEF